MVSVIPYGKQFINRQDIEDVVKVLNSGWISQGPKIKEFEEALADYCGSRYAVAVSSGTAALHIACLAAGLKRGDEAITSPITFVATANSIIYAGAKPVLADIDFKTVNIDPQEILKKIKAKTKAVLPVHFAGLPCDMEKISGIAKKHSLTVIEDACHALGASYKYKGKWINVGSCKHSDMTVFSFHPVKSITTGEGGAITTNNKELYKKLLALRSHGIYKDESMTGRYGSWYYEMRDLGFNYRITDFQCALGMSQLKKISAFLKRRRQIAAKYDSAFRKIPFVKIPAAEESKKTAYHIYVLKIDFEKFNTTRRRFMDRLKKAGISTQVHYIPVYRHPYYIKNFGFDRRKYPESERYYKEALTIPLYPSMSDKDVDRVIKVISDSLEA